MTDDVSFRCPSFPIFHIFSPSVELAHLLLHRGADRRVSLTQYSSDDPDSFLSFLTALRAAVGDDILLAADTSSEVWVDSSGSTATDLSGFAEVCVASFLLSPPCSAALPYGVRSS
jgi:hypothetical protein